MAHCCVYFGSHVHQGSGSEAYRAKLKIELSGARHWFFVAMQRRAMEVGEAQAPQAPSWRGDHRVIVPLWAPPLAPLT